MSRYIILRLVQLVPVILVASVLIWLMIFLVPGDPAIVRAGLNATPAQIQIARQEMGLDQPLPLQYALWLSAAVRGDLGRSLLTGVPVLELLGQRIPVTLQLAVTAAFISVVVAFPVAILAGIRPRSWFARGVSLYTSLTLAIPTFWLGTLLVMFFGVWLRVLPASGYVAPWDDPIGSLEHVLLPALALGTYMSGVLIRFLRASLEESMDRDYITTARSKGLSEGVVVRRHGLRNALIPVVTVVGLQFGTFLGGAVITEAVFNYPGVGLLMLNAVIGKDFPVIQGTLLLIVVAFCVVNLAVDVLYRFLDPRIHYS